MSNNSKFPIWKIIGFGSIIIVILVLFPLINSTFFDSGRRYINQEEIRKECTTRRNNLDTAYERAQNQYSNASAIITDQVAVANLSTEAKKEINEAALNAIFGQPNQTTESSINNLINTAAKYNLEFDKTDDQLFRNIQESIRVERNAFRYLLDEFSDKKRNFRQYLIDESSRFRIGEAEIELVDALDSNDCLPGAYQIKKTTNKDILAIADEILDKTYVLPRTFETNKAFTEGQDGGFIKSPSSKE